MTRDEVIEALERGEIGRDLSGEVVKSVIGHWRPFACTTSLDDVLALLEEVLPGWQWSMERGHGIKIGPCWVAKVYGPGPGSNMTPTVGSAPAPAAALCIAILKATGDESDTNGGAK